MQSICWSYNWNIIINLEWWELKFESTSYMNSIKMLRWLFIARPPTSIVWERVFLFCLHLLVAHQFYFFSHFNSLSKSPTSQTCLSWHLRTQVWKPQWKAINEIHRGYILYHHCYNDNKSNNINCIWVSMKWLFNHLASMFFQVDSMLGRRENPGEHEAMRKMKNEFMVNWDGLRTKDKERVLVLAATNRPFDLDEAVIRRLPRRYSILCLSYPFL